MTILLVLLAMLAILAVASGLGMTPDTHRESTRHGDFRF